MKIYSPDYVIKKGKGLWYYIGMGLLGGVVLAFLIIWLGKALFILLKIAISLIINYWHYILGGIIVLILIKKIFGKKKIIHVNQYENNPR